MPLKKKRENINGSANNVEPEEIQVDFEGQNPSVEDFDGIKQLLGQMFLKAHINTNELTNIIIGQNYVGSVIKQCYDDNEGSSDEDDDANIVLGITTAVNITGHQNLESLAQIKDFLLNKAENNGTGTEIELFKTALNGDNVTGLLINERFVNIPPQISLPLLENLQKELLTAVNKNKPFNFCSFIVISKFYRKEDKQGKFIENLLSNAEEEAFVQHSIASFDYTVKEEADSGLDGAWDEDDLQMIPFRRVILLDAKSLPDIISSIKELLS